MTRATQKPEANWLKACDIRGPVDQLMQDVEDTARSAQWIGHLMNRLQLTDHQRRKPYMGGQMYAVARTEVIDMMHRYDVPVLSRQFSE